MPSQINKSDYSLSITLPVFGPIPLHPKEIFRDLMIKENPPLWAQFFKYGICGILSLIITIAIVLFVEFQWPHYLDENVPTSTRQLHMSIVLVCAFIPSNFFAYFTNRFFVFTPGRHSIMLEAIIFTIISACSFAGGELGKRLMIELGYSNIVATLSFAVSSALVNFIARKFIIFKN